MRLFFVTAGLIGCIAGVDESGPLQVVSTRPTPGGLLAAGDALRVRFDRYLEPGVDAQAATVLSSGDQAFDVRVAYDPVDRALVFTPPVDLRAGLGYVLTLDVSGVRGLDGAALDEPYTLSFVATTPAEPSGRVERVDFESEIAPVLARRCGCHGPAPSRFPSMSPDALVGIESRLLPGLDLVEPGAPLDSQLVRKLLPGYPETVGRDMPPDGPLTPAELRTIISWVAAGASSAPTRGGP